MDCTKSLILKSICRKLIELLYYSLLYAVAGLIYKITCVMVKGPNKNYQTNNESAEIGGSTRLSIFPTIMGHQTGNQARTGEGLSDQTGDGG